MKSSIFFRATAIAGFVLGPAVLMAPSCYGDDVTGPAVKAQGCTVTTDPGFPYQGEVFLNKPAQCPVKLGGSSPLPYEASADFVAGTVAYQFYQNEYIDRMGGEHGFVANQVWSQGNGRYYVNVSGTYYPAIGGFDPYNNGYDDVRNGFLGNNGWTYATTRVTYTFGAPSVYIANPGDVAPNSPYTLTATTDDPNFVGPVNWSWYHDGTLLGTTTNADFSVTAGAEGTQQLIQVVGVDYNGYTHSTSISVNTQNSCGGVAC